MKDKKIKKECTVEEFNKRSIRAKKAAVTKANNRALKKEQEALMQSVQENKDPKNNDPKKEAHKPRVKKTVQIDNSNNGRVISIKDGIVIADGLPNAAYGEMVKINNTDGMILNLEKDSIGIVIFGNDNTVNVGDCVVSTNDLMSVKAAAQLVGRVLNGLGHPIDGRAPVALEQTTDLYIERKAPGVITRESITESLLTGIKSIDSLLPIGKGQRELIIGDRQTGKTTMALDTILNQNRDLEEPIDTYCIYVAIGLKRSSVLDTFNLLKANGALRYTIIVAATASESAPLQFLAPYTGTSLAEAFRDAGYDALIVYDDLSKHAIAYRQMSLLLRRPAGREAYPGDIFYAHSRLLERSCSLGDFHGSGSLTALPIIETQAGDVSGYIPTNVISITDGQIFLEKELFNKGIRPAVNVGLSVSRVGSAAQPNIITEVAGSLKLELALYREVAMFAKFASDIDDSTKETLYNGRLLTEVLKQPQNQPLELYEQVMILFAALNGYLDDVSFNKITDYQTRLLRYLKSPIYEGFLPYLVNVEFEEEFEVNNNPIIFLLDYFKDYVYTLEDTKYWVKDTLDFTQLCTDFEIDIHTPLEVTEENYDDTFTLDDDFVL